MNLKVAHLISVQFGIFVGIVACLAFFRFEFGRPRTPAEMRKPATERATTLDPRSEPADQAADLTDDDVSELDERIAGQSIPAMPNEYSPEAVEKSRAILTKLYYEQIAPRRNPSSGRANAPSYAEVAQEPAAVQVEEPAPQTVAYEQPPQVIVYPQPAQFISFARPRRFDNRCRPAPHPNALASNPHRRQNNGGMTHLSFSPAFVSPAPPSAALRPPPASFGNVHRGDTGGPFCPSTPGVGPRGKR
jgi:hypothetical protein